MVIRLPRRLVKPWHTHPAVVTLTAEEGDEILYGLGVALIAERRQARAASLGTGGSCVERARGRVRMCEFEPVLIRDELTLPPSRYPWDEDRRCDELLRGKLAFVAACWELVQALYWRWVWLVLTLGRWRR